MDKTLRQMLVEGFKDVLERVELDDQAGVISNIEDIDVKDSNQSNKLLDLQDIARTLITGTESEFRDTISISEAWNAIKSQNEYVRKLETAEESEVPELLINAMKQYFIPPVETIDSACYDLSTMFSRYIILEAYSLIFKDYSQTLAGYANEAFIAGLLGGTTLPPKSGTLADLVLANGDIGVSLKTIDASKGLDASFATLMRTLGIKYKSEGKGKAYSSSVDTPVHSKGLYYLLMNKETMTSHTIKVFKINREEFINKMDELLEKEDDGTYVIPSRTYKNKLANIAPLLGAKFVNISDGTLGVSDYISIEQRIDLQQPVVENAQNTNIGKILDTLSLLNDFYALYTNSVIKFTSEPNIENLNNLKKQFLEMSKIDPRSLVVNSECSN